jgi:hypothetical protein
MLQQTSKKDKCILEYLDVISTYLQVSNKGFTLWQWVIPESSFPLFLLGCSTYSSVIVAAVFHYDCSTDANEAANSTGSLFCSLLPSLIGF